MSVDYKAYFAEHRETHLNELKEWLSIPSISALSEHKGDVAKVAEWLAGKLTEAGLDHVEVHQTAGHPIITADYLHAEGKPTVLVYGHYDVQPVDPLHLWKPRPLSRLSATANCMHAEQRTTKANSSCMSKPSKLF